MAPEQLTPRNTRNKNSPLITAVVLGASHTRLEYAMETCESCRGDGNVIVNNAKQDCVGCSGAGQAKGKIPVPVRYLKGEEMSVFENELVPQHLVRKEEFEEEKRLQEALSKARAKTPAGVKVKKINVSPGTHIAPLGPSGRGEEAGTGGRDQ